MNETEVTIPPSAFYPTFWRESDQDNLQAWWEWLKENKGERARLRRCETPAMVLGQSAFHRLCRKLPWWERRDLMSLAAVAGLLAHIDGSIPVSFAAQMGKAREGSENPRLSELRFQQILASEHHEELFNRLRRAIHLLDRSANILSVADGVFHWAADQKDGFSEQPSKRFHYAWARDYFGEVFKYQKENHS